MVVAVEFAVFEGDVEGVRGLLSPTLKTWLDGGRLYVADARTEPVARAVAAGRGAARFYRYTRARVASAGGGEVAVATRVRVLGFPVVEVHLVDDAPLTLPAAALSACASSTCIAERLRPRRARPLIVAGGIRLPADVDVVVFGRAGDAVLVRVNPDGTARAVAYYAPTAPLVLDKPVGLVLERTRWTLKPVPSPLSATAPAVKRRLAELEELGETA